MKIPVRKFKSMEVALKALEPYIKNGTHLETGRPFQNFGDMRSREAVVNWLLCATVNAVNGRKLSFTTTNNLIGGDGNIYDEMTGEIFSTEHVMVSRQSGGADADTQALILKEINNKLKKGKAYASGKTLVAFANADTGTWHPNKVAKGLPDPLYFAAVWVVSLREVKDGVYIYNLAHLDLSDGDAPAFLVRINNGFDDWEVATLQ